MFENYHEFVRSKFAPLHLAVGDSIKFTYKGPAQDVKGILGLHTETVLAEAKVDADHAMTVDEAVIFAATFEGRRIIGAFVMEQKS